MVEADVLEQVVDGFQIRVPELGQAAQARAPLRSGLHAARVSAGARWDRELVFRTRRHQQPGLELLEIRPLPDDMLERIGSRPLLHLLAAKLFAPPTVVRSEAVGVAQRVGDLAQALCHGHRPRWELG